MMKLGNIDSTIEAVNFLLSKVPQPYIGDYVIHVKSQPGHPRNARDAIVPGIHATNNPSGRQLVNDSGASRSADAIFEMKNLNFCPTRYNHNNVTTNPANRCAREVVNEYKLKFKNLDVKFASATLGDGTNGVIGPFMTA